MTEFMRVKEIKNKIDEFVKEHPSTKRYIVFAIIIIALVLSLIFGIPLLINCAYNTPASCSCFAVDWEAKDALGYYGSVLGFLGTVIFSALALWQNHIIQQANIKHTQLLDQMEQAKSAPILSVSAAGSNYRAANLYISIHNISKNIAEKLYAYGFAIVDETGTTLWRDDETLSIDHLYDSKIWDIELENPQVTSCNHQFVFEIRYSDIVGNMHMCKVVGSFSDKISLPQFRVTEV